MLLGWIKYNFKEFAKSKKLHSWTAKNGVFVDFGQYEPQYLSYPAYKYQITWLNAALKRVASIKADARKRALATYPLNIYAEHNRLMDEVIKGNKQCH